MKTLLFLLFICLVCGMEMQAQQLIDDYQAIVKDANEHYEKYGKKAPGYKQYKRWEWYNAGRLMPDGKLANNYQLNLHALQSSAVNRENITTANTGAWSFIGPTSVASNDRGIGRVNRLAFHPTNPDIIYAACATGGLWITTDGGANWYSYTEGIPNMSLSGVAVNYNNTNEIFILTGDADAITSGARAQFSYGKGSTGVLQSNNGGFNWHQTTLKFAESDNIALYKMLMHPTNPAVLLVVGDNGIWRTSNGGSSWTQMNSNIDFYDMEFHPTTPSIVYVSGIEGDSVVLYKSTDDGLSFSKSWATVRLNNFNGNRVVNRSALAVSAANPDYVYLLAGPCTASGTFQGIYRSTNKGVTFTQRSNAPNLLGRSSTGADTADQSRYDLALAVNPTNSAQLVTGGIRVWTSTNSGSTFTYRDNYVIASNYYHDDIHDLVYHPLNSGRLYMCADGGVYFSTDNGASWSGLNSNLPISQYYKIAINPNNVFGTENVMIGGLQDNGTNKRSTSGGSTFSQVLGADGMDCFIDPDAAATYVASIQDGKFYYSSNSGSSFETVGDAESIGKALNTNVFASWVTPVAEITGRSDQFIIGYNPVVKVTRITPGAYVFANIGGEVGSRASGLTLLKTARGNADRIYAGDANATSSNPARYREIHTTTDGGTNWSLIFYQEFGTAFTDLTFDADNGSRIWVTFGGYQAGKKVWYSATGGGTSSGDWTNISGSLPNVPVNCIVFDDNNGSPSGAVYIGTDIGIFYRDNSLGDWIPFSNGLPVVEITDLEIHKATGKLRAGTYGRGIWESDLYSNCVSAIALNTSNTQSFRPYYFQAAQSISSTAAHEGTGAFVYYKAGSEIVLSPGFKMSAAVDNEFKGYIGPCGGGVPTLLARPVVALRGVMQ